MLFLNYHSRGSYHVGSLGNPLGKWIGFAAIVLATINVVGGFMVTDRMLEMFKKKEDEK